MMDFYLQQSLCVSFSPFSRFPLLLMFCCDHQVSGLKPGQKYLYRVCAENAAGVSDPAEQVGPLLADDPHGTR